MPISRERALDRYRMGMKSGGSIRAVSVLAGPDACPSCQSLAGIVYPLDEAPVLPNPSCTSPDGCRCAYRPVMAYDPAAASIRRKAMTEAEAPTDGAAR